MTLNSKEENCFDFCLDFVQEFVWGHIGRGHIVMASSVLPVTDTSAGQAVTRRTLQLKVSKKENKLIYFYEEVQYMHVGT
jgi:hypothetical protein